VSGTDLANPQGGVDEGNQQGKTSGSRLEPPFRWPVFRLTARPSPRARRVRRSNRAIPGWKQHAEGGCNSKRVCRHETWSDFGPKKARVGRCLQT